MMGIAPKYFRGQKPSPLSQLLKSVAKTVLLIVFGLVGEMKSPPRFIGSCWFDGYSGVEQSQNPAFIKAFF